MKIYLFLILIIISLSASAQSDRLHEIFAASPLKITRPIETDSTDRNGKKFADETLLKLKVAIPSHERFTARYEADTAGFFMLSSDDSAYIQMFTFAVEATEYGKAKIKITSPDLLEIFVNGKSVATKTTAEDSIEKAKSVSADISPYPQTCRVVIKLLHLSTGKNAALKAEIDNPKEGAKAQVAVAEKRRMVLDDVINGKRVGGTSLSPSGNYVIISYYDTYGANTTYSYELYTVATGRRVTLSGGRSWMPTSDLMWFTRKEGNRSDIITMSPETLEEQVFARDVPDERFAISPDEKALFYSKNSESGSQSQQNLFRMETLTNRQGGKSPISFIYRFDLQTGMTRQLTFGSHTTYINDISKDGSQILVATSEEVITERPFRKGSLYLLNINTMQIDTLWEDEKWASRASFSPDGKSLLITGAPDAFNGIGLDIAEGQTANSYDTQAFMMDLKTKNITPLTKSFDPSIDNAVWSKFDNLIYLQVTVEDRAAVYTLDPKSGKFTRLPSEEDVVNGFQIAKSSPVMTYHGVSISGSTRAYVYNLKTRKQTVIADPYAEQLAEMRLGEVYDFDFTNSDATLIKGHYFLPPDFDPTKKYPLIVYYYGGTTPTTRVFESRYPKHAYAALGYVVYVVQPAGAIGFGQKFSALHVNTWGKRSAEDIIEGTQQFCSAHPFVDATKIGCMGASYGGFMTMYLQTRTDIFAAAVSHAGISSITSYWGEGYWGYAYSSAASANSYPWNNYDLYINQSPLFNADKINTPLLLLHGTSDTNVPVGESIQMFTALKILGKPVELVQVRGEDHHISNYDKRQQWNNTIFAWFDKWLKGQDAWWKEIYKD
ncbi:MAG: prolyl oligopeptidase family serine peptidase [Tannerella sp.]|jgi:dipeptidyl aminopeptidase/acylaminoacyl peptidase|nr:prolyl oligopeptidase family serine peptidase [Tannerella sp.]